MSGRGLNLKYYTGKVSSDSDNQKSKSLGLKNWNNLRREFDFLSRVSTWQKMTFELDFYAMGTNIKCRNQWKIEKLSLCGNLFCIFPLYQHQNFETLSDYNGQVSNDTFELTSINGIPIFVSAEWRDASNGSKSIADWVYETNKPVAPICYFKALSQKAKFW